MSQVAEFIDKHKVALGIVGVGVVVVFVVWLYLRKKANQKEEG